MVVLLQGHDDLAILRHINVLRLGILGRDGREAGEVRQFLRPAQSTMFPLAARAPPGAPPRQLRDRAVVDLLIALILDRDGEHARVAATESGWPGSGHSAAIVRVGEVTVTSLPLGL